MRSNSLLPTIRLSDLESAQKQIPRKAVLRIKVSRNKKYAQWQWRDADQKTCAVYVAPLEPLRTTRRLTDGERDKLRRTDRDTEL